MPDLYASLAACLQSGIYAGLAVPWYAAEQELLAPEDAVYLSKTFKILLWHAKLHQAASSCISMQHHT